MASPDLWIMSPPFFFIPPGYFTVEEMYGLKTNDNQLFFTKSYRKEVNYCPFLDMSADTLSEQGHIPGFPDKGYNFRLMEQDVY